MEFRHHGNTPFWIGPVDTVMAARENQTPILDAVSRNVSTPIVQSQKKKYEIFQRYVTYTPRALIQHFPYPLRRASKGMTDLGEYGRNNKQLKTLDISLAVLLKKKNAILKRLTLH
jgi:hypothetical protein